MKALTLTEPWATLVALGEKKIETRSWACYYTGPLAIHSGKNYMKREFRDLVSREPFYTALRPGGQYADPELTCGHVLAITRMVKCLRTEMVDLDEMSEQELAFGNYVDGRFAFFLAPVYRVRPVPAKGALGLWDWDGKVELL